MNNQKKAEEYNGKKGKERLILQSEHNALKYRKKTRSRDEFSENTKEGIL
jgi:hypothetical protein